MRRMSGLICGPQCNFICFIPPLSLKYLSNSDLFIMLNKNVFFNPFT